MAKIPTQPYSSDSSSSFWRSVARTKAEQEDMELWDDIREATKNNKTLQSKFEELKVLYLLVKE